MVTLKQSRADVEKACVNQIAIVAELSGIVADGKSSAFNYKLFST